MKLSEFIYKLKVLESNNGDLDVMDDECFGVTARLEEPDAEELAQYPKEWNMPKKWVQIYSYK